MSQLFPTSPAAPVGIDAARLPDGADITLSVRDLRKSFDGVHAVDGVSFDVGRGEVVSIIGPNGSGKTTTLNLVSGVLRAQEGEISLDRVAVERAGAETVAEAGLSRTFQNGRVFAALTVAENVEVGLHSTLRATRPWRSLSRLPVLRWLPLVAETVLALVPGPRSRRELAALSARVDDELARFGERLVPRREHQAYTLSYANRRRTEIARALAPSPRLLLLDEPTAGMNTTETAEVLDQLLALKAAGQTILLVEHKLDLVLTVSDRVLVMDDGRLIAAGSPAVVRNDPAVIEAYLGRRQQRERRAVVEVLPRPSAGAMPTRPLAVETADVPQHAAPLLALDAVDVFYGAAQALHAITLDVRAGEIVSLLGGNASGKSTTMKTILGLVKPRSGQVRLDAQDLAGVSTPARIRRGIAAVPEARRIFGQMTVRENLITGAYTRRDGAINDDLERMFTYFPRLAERHRQEAGTLSGGEQQMLAFARALMSRPRLVCMDEPTMGLSPLFVDRVLDEIARINAELGVAVLMVEQQAELALSIAHRGYVLAQGRIVLAGDAADLLDDPAIQEAYLGRNPQQGPDTDLGAGI
ncbi:MAG: ATP-binding cassette domain-containing protein [Cellulomonas sp.]